mmetsp:Transcript_10334/g.26215  ORF Transcript_10334/g.26215 Transcript_10334/m.26215 type:complete len:304 (+) Transcript_10334:62-973(+)
MELADLENVAPGARRGCRGGGGAGDAAERAVRAMEGGVKKKMKKPEERAFGGEQQQRKKIPLATLAPVTPLVSLADQRDGTQMDEPSLDRRLPNTAAIAHSHRPRHHQQREEERKHQQAQRRKVKASEAKAVEMAVLSLYQKCTTQNEVDESIFGSYDEAVTFENPVIKTLGVGQLRSLFQLARKLAHSYKVIKPVKVGLWLEGGEDDAGAKLLLDYKLECQLMRFTPRLRVHYFTSLRLGADGKVVAHRDHWCLGSVFENIPIVGSVIYPWTQSTIGWIASTVGRLTQPKVSLIYKILLKGR